MFAYQDLYKLVFDKTIDADELDIITGYVGPAIVKDLATVPFQVNLYIGMYGNDIGKILHNSLLRSDKIENININYTKILIHSKCYIWKKNNNVVRVLIGSANFSTSGLMTPKKEVLGELPNSVHKHIDTYLNLVQQESYSVSDYVPSETGIIAFIDEITRSISEKEVEISLLAARSGGSSNIVGVSTNPGDVPAAAGLNWGFSNGLPKPNDAYIKIPKEQIFNNPLMFPEKKEDINEPIDVIWDDGIEMQMLLEGVQNVEDREFPKQISTYKNKSELGQYLRKRIGDALGKELVLPDLKKEDFVPKAHFYRERLITRDMLEEYGRTSINIKLIGERTYYFNFSTHKLNKEN